MALPIFAPPIGLTFPVVRRPLWQTLKQPAISGKDNPIQLQSYPRWQYELPFRFLRSDANAEFQYVAGFYNSVGGDAQAFLYSDPDDNSATTQNFGTGDGATTAFGLVRTFGGFIEPVFAPIVDGTFHVFDNGVDVTANVTVGNAGLVTFNSGAPVNGHVLTWTGSFRWVCRFDDGNLDFSKFLNQFWELKKLSFTTLKLNPGSSLITTPSLDFSQAGNSQYVPLL